MASLQVVVICSVLLTSLLAPALARIYIVDDGLPDGAVASGSDSKGFGAGSSSSGGGGGGGVQLIRRPRDAAAGRHHQGPSGEEAATATTARQRSRGRKKYKDTLAEADVRSQEAFEALRTVEKRIRPGVDPSTGGPQASGAERYRRRKPQEPPPPQQLQERPPATRGDEPAASGQQPPTAGDFSGSGPSGTGPSSEGADYDDGEINQEAPELLRVAPQHQPPTAPDSDPLYPSSAYSETNPLAAASSYQSLALGVTTSSPYSANLAYSTIGKDSDYSESNRNSLHFTPSDSRINPYAKTVDHIQYAQVSDSTGVSSQADTLRDGSSDRLENQISSSYGSSPPVSDSPSLTDRPVTADDVVAYIHSKYESQLPAASQQEAYSFQEFNSGQTVVRHSGHGAPDDLQPSTSNVYNNFAGTGQNLRTVSQNTDQNNEPVLSKQLMAAGGSDATSFQSSTRLNSRPHFDDGRPSEVSHRLVHTGPVFKFTLDDRMTPPTGYEQRQHGKEANQFEAGVHSGAHVATRKGKSMAFAKQGGTGERKEITQLARVKSQESGLGKVQFANVGSTLSVSTGIDNSETSGGHKGLRSSTAVVTAEAFQGDLRESNVGGLVVTSAPALGSKVQRDTEGFLGNHVSASRTVTGTLKFAPSAPDQTAMASGEATANFLPPSSDHHQTQKRTTAQALSNDPFALTVGAKLQTGTGQPLAGENREARFSFPQSGSGDHHRMVFPDKVAHGAGYGASAGHQAPAHGQGLRPHQPQVTYVQRPRPQRQPGSDIVYGSPPRPGAGRVQRPWGLARPARGAPHPHPHRQRRLPRAGRPLRPHKPPPAGHGDSAPSGSSSAGSAVVGPAPSYGGGSSPPHVSFVEAGPWGQFRWSVSHDVALKPAFHWR